MHKNKSILLAFLIIPIFLVSCGGWNPTSVKDRPVDVDQRVKQNIEEARYFAEDPSLFTSRDQDVLGSWDVPMAGHVITGGLVQKTCSTIHWPLFTLMFADKPSLTQADFYHPFEQTCGPFETLSLDKQTYINETFRYLSQQLAQPQESSTLSESSHH